MEKKRQATNRANSAISLTTFVDFVSASRVAKINVVRRFVDQQVAGYAQHRDYYATFRRSLVAFHRSGRPMAEFFDYVTESVDSRKVANYGHLARGYARCWATWFQESEFAWIEPPRDVWRVNEWVVKVNPELAFSDGHRATFVKMYLKQEDLAKESAELVLHLLQVGLSSWLQNATVAVLDVRRGRLYEATSFDDRLSLWLRGELASFKEIYGSVLSESRKSIADGTN